MHACLPICASVKTVKNGRIHNGKQRFKCHDCGRQFVDQATRELIDRLLLERLYLGLAEKA